LDVDLLSKRCKRNEEVAREIEILLIFPLACGIARNDSSSNKVISDVSREKGQKWR
jgi:hypothetical protein